jgi:dTMP kinase
LDREQLALYFDALAFVASALITLTIAIPKKHVKHEDRLKFSQTFRDMKEGVQFIAGHPLVRGVIYGLAGALLGGGMMIPLGPVFSTEVLGEGNSGFGLLMFALGFGAAGGVITLVLLQKRAPLEQVFWIAIVATGSCILVAASFSAIVPAMFVAILLGASAGTGYVAGFTLLQRHSHDEVRGRTFSALYTLIRVCLLISLTVTPLLAGAFDEISEWLLDDRAIVIGGQTIGLPGVRLALWMGGLIAIAAGLFTRRELARAHALEDHDGSDTDAAAESPPAAEAG